MADKKINRYRKNIRDFILCDFFDVKNPSYSQVLTALKKEKRPTYNWATDVENSDIARKEIEDTLYYIEYTKKMERITKIFRKQQQLDMTAEQFISLLEIKNKGLCTWLVKEGCPERMNGLKEMMEKIRLGQKSPILKALTGWNIYV